MTNTIELKVPSQECHFNIVKFIIKERAIPIHFTDDDIEDLISATYELFHNAIVHAYSENLGFITIEFHSFDYGIRIDIHDYGMPMSPHKYSSVPINLKEDKGFNRIYKLVDKFEYTNLGKSGKKFSIIKYIKHTVYTPFEKLQHQLEDMVDTQTKIHSNIQVRNFQSGDEEAIAKLIYQNYGHSYVKDIFYYPKKILELQNQKIFSIVALEEEKIVGHFALVKIPHSNIAEVGVVVVHPKYKGLGIMNSMFDKLIQRAQELKFDAIFGEAIMYHVFSQKSNIKQHFYESALLLGRSPDDLTIENNILAKKKLRGSVLISYKIFHYTAQQLTLPEVYKEKILETYHNAKLNIRVINHKALKKAKKQNMHLNYTYDPLLNIATIIIDHYGKHFKHKFLLLLSQLRSKHCDMIYAEINLNNMPQIDYIVHFLNKRGFFYAGVLFLKYKNQDYLCLQNRHSMQVGRKNVVCYSPFCHTLLDYIHKDELRIK